MAVAAQTSREEGCVSQCWVLTVAHAIQEPPRALCSPASDKPRASAAARISLGLV